MNQTEGEIQGQNINITPAEKNAGVILKTIREPLLVLDKDLKAFAANLHFQETFNLAEENIKGKFLWELDDQRWNDPALLYQLKEGIPENGSFADLEINYPTTTLEPGIFLVNGGRIQENGEEYYLLTFQKKNKVQIKTSNLVLSSRNFENILAHAPAMICILRGPEFIFEVANDRYYQLIGNRDIIGKPVKQAIPEVVGQGFFDLLDRVWKTGEPYTGSEVPFTLIIETQEVKHSFIDFTYQPTFNEKGNVDGIFVYVVDVTEKVLVRQQIEKSENELRKIIDTVPAMIWITDKEGKSIYLNQNWYDYTGQNREEAIGFGWLNVTHPDDKDIAEESFINAHNERRPYSVTFRIRNKNGEYRWVIDSGRPKFSLDGDYEGMMGTVVDVHEERIKEKVIADTEHRYRELIYSSPSLIATFKGKDYIIEIANNAIIEAWGKGPDVIGKPLLEVIPEVIDQGIDKILEEVFTTGKPFKGYEMPLKLVKNGKMEQFYFNFTYYPQRDAQGNVVGIVDIATEVTPQAIISKTIKESESHFRQMADLMPTKVTNTDAKGNFVYFNQGWIDYTGRTSEELKKEGWTNLIHHHEKSEFEKRWNSSLQTGENFEMEIRCVNKAGKYKWHLSRSEAVRGENGEISMWINTNTEIQKLKEEEKRKGDFLKMVSHELKTPVTSIKGYVQLLLSMLKMGNSQVSLSKIPVKPSLERIDYQISRLTRLISEMLDLSRIEENKLELQKEVFNLNDLVNETVQDILYTNTQHKIQMLHEFNCKVYADRDRIGQVLINFITNAIKYSPQSQDIIVRIQKHRNNQVSVNVKDQGIGIEKKNHRNIFKRFYRIGGKGEETYSGFGIGLYLAQEIIQRHNGIITLKSKKGKGSDFCFILSVASEKN